MIKALAFCCGLDLGPREIAELACYIELEKMGMPVGKQDQYAAAFGGLNCISFDKSGVVVEPLKVSSETRKGLESGIMLFFSSPSQQSAAILQRQHQANRQRDQATLHRLQTIKQLSQEMRTALEQAELETFGRLLHRSWLEKRALVEGITNPSLDRFYEVARANGAIGGKVTGAGGGGFLMLYCPEERQAAVTEALAELGLRKWPFTLEDEGVRIMQVIPWSREPISTPPVWSQPEMMQRSSFVT
jgi:D-glycero-alpha-D-manno-heptose-7-phosphate kinase